MAKRQGAKIYAEVTPHHFTLNENAILKYGSLAKMNPPLRTEEDRPINYIKIAKKEEKERRKGRMEGRKERRNPTF